MSTKHLLDGRDLGGGEVGAADLRRGRSASAAVGVGGGDGEQRGGLALAEVVADGLAGDGLVAEGAEQVVAELERLAERVAVGGQRRLQVVEPAGQRGAEVERALDRVLARLVAGDPPGALVVGVGPRGAERGRGTGRR